MMNRFLSLWMLWLCQLALFAQVGGADGSYDPANPPNPGLPKYTLTLTASPEGCARFNYDNGSQFYADNHISLRAYTVRSFVFDYWLMDGEVVSTDYYLDFSMPEHDVTLTAVCHYDPASPGNPESVRKKYTVTLVSQPDGAGTFNWNDQTKVEEGRDYSVIAYPNYGFEFKGWRNPDGVLVSTEQEYQFTMPSEDLTLTAEYEYNPRNPSNPRKNYWDSESGIVIVDDFETGRLYDAIWELTSGDEENVKSITVAGVLSTWDWSIANNWPDCEFLDLSRTTGLNYVPSWSFADNSTLQTIYLPASVEMIQEYAFAYCTSLTTIGCYAVTPPALRWDVFQNVDPAQVTVYVPAEALPLYQNADGWKDFTIMAFREQVSALTVNLPENAQLSLYKDMYIELLNMSSGQKMRYVVTGRRDYTYNNLMHNTTYNVYLKNLAGEVLGTIENVEVGEESAYSVAFESLLVPQDVTLKVLTPDNEDVTSDVTITWTDDKGAYLTRGSKLTAQLEGTAVACRITLPQSLGMQYLLPEEVTYEVVDGENVITYTLQGIPMTTISGTVKNLKTEEPLEGAIVAVSQTLNGLYSKAFSTRTDSDGSWMLPSVYVAPTEVTASKPDYLSASVTMETLQADGENVVPVIELKDINGTAIMLTLQTSDGVVADLTNMNFEVYNLTTGEQYADVSVQSQNGQNPRIVLMTSHEAGTELRIVVSSKNQKFMPVETTCTVQENDKANAVLVIKELGGIESSYKRTDNHTVVGILYGADGNLMKSYGYSDSKQLAVNELLDGEYTLVTMGGSHFFNSIGSLSQFAQSDLREGVDYLKTKVNVISGEKAKIDYNQIPYLDETKFYYTGSNTSFKVNKSQVTAGQYLTLESHVDFKEMYKDQVSNLSLIVTLPAKSPFVQNSVMLGNSLSDYTDSGQQIVIPLPLDRYTERTRFCIIPTAGGDYSVAASVQFTYGDKIFQQPIGSASFTVEDLSVNVPAVVAGVNVPVSGSAMGRSNVCVYVDSLLLGQTTASPNGLWATTVQLENPETGSAHQVYVVVSTPLGIEMQSENRTVVYDDTAVQVDGVTMYYTNPEENWWRGRNYELFFNFMSPSVSPFRYTYYIYNRLFSFAVKFNQNESLSKVILDVKTGDGRWNPLVTKYDSRKELWLVNSEFGNMYDGVVPVNVRVRFVRKGDNSDNETVVCYPGPDCDVPIDPSGFVYEAVSSNRVQGAKATIWYKEERSNEYGDLYVVEEPWNAEEYAQENPLFTDADGMYRWDVPQGLWQVRLEKEGYEPTRSEWLPVPPPQLDVNLPMKQMLQPTVQKASFSEEGVELEFDKYMDPATLTVENIVVTKNDVLVNGTIELLNEEPVTKEATQTYVSKLRFGMPEGEKLTTDDNVQLTVRRQVKSYAGVMMQEDYTQRIDAVAKVRQISVKDLVNVAYNQTATLRVGALPEDVSKGKLLLVSSLSETIAKATVNEIQLDENGEAELTISGEMPGSTVLSFRVVESTDEQGRQYFYDTEGRTTVNVLEPEKLTTAAPVASRVSGALVYRGTVISLSTQTENAKIYYTLDGSEPTEESEVYEQPFVINSDEVTIMAMAVGRELARSEVVTFVYRLRKAERSYDLPAGWKWISHNMDNPVAVSEFQENAERILGQTAEAVNDPSTGFVGSLTELLATQSYKVKVSAQTGNVLSGYEFDATTNTIPVEVGWNWIGYPVSQTMTLAEAFEFFAAAEGDYVVGQNGFAEFTDGEWKGTLDSMNPGEGYLYKSSVKSALLFNTTIGSELASRRYKAGYLVNSPWAPAKYAYPDVMPLTAYLYKNGVNVGADEFVVGAFAGTECRGVGVWQDDRLQMSVYGQSGDNIRFVAMQLANGQIYDLTEQLSFAADNVGTWNAPYVLTVYDETTRVDQMDGRFAVTPAVIRDHVTVTAGGKDISLLTLTNMSGQTVVSLTDLGKGATVTIGQLPEGMYIVTIQAGGRSYYKKILKIND